MGLFDNIRKKEKMEQKVNEYFKLMNAYSPSFSTFEGGVYEMELTRAAIHSFATHVSKLKPETKGTAAKRLENTLQHKPNKLMDTSKYLYRLATIYMVDNTAFIAPLYDNRMQIIGYYPLLTNKCQIINVGDTKYLRYDFGSGNYGAVELESAGIMTQFQYRSEIYGESNACMKPTLDLLNVQNQGIIEGVKQSASIRFMAKLANTLKPADIKAERERFVSENLSASNNGGVLLFDQKYEDVKQIQSEPFVVSDKQMQIIKENVFNYFGTNEKILQNDFTSSSWSAYYEGKIEPFAIQASLVHSNMTFSQRELAQGNEIFFSANRLQYLEASEKLNIVTSLFDRGMMTQNDGREVFNMPAVDDGDKYYIRKEYTEVQNLDDAVQNTEETDEQRD